MKIGEIAERAGVATSKIRFYERRGIIPEARRDQNGYRDYPEKLVERLRFIEKAQNLGFTLKEVSSVEISSGDHPVSCELALELLARKLGAVELLIAEAQDRKQRIVDMMAELEASRQTRSIL